MLNYSEGDDGRLVGFQPAKYDQAVAVAHTGWLLCDYQAIRSGDS